MTANVSNTDPAKGARDVIERELKRQDARPAESEIRRQDVLASLRDADDHLIAEIIGTGATLQEFGEALHWLSDDEAAWRPDGPRPAGRIGQLADLIRAAEDARPPAGRDDEV